MTWIDWLILASTPAITVAWCWLLIYVDPWLKKRSKEREQQARRDAGNAKVQEFFETYDITKQ